MHCFLVFGYGSQSMGDSFYSFLRLGVDSIPLDAEFFIIMPLLKFGYQTDSRSTPVSKKLLRPKQKAMPRQPRESPPQALIDNNASLPSPSSGEAHGASTAQDSICGKEKLGIVSICSGCSSIHSSLIDFLGCCIGGEFVRIFSILPYWFVLPIRTTDEQAAMQ